jgi:transcriptional regulator
MLDSDGGLVRGTLDLLVLKALMWGPRHGYAVAEWVKTVTEGELLVEEGPLYTALHRLEKNGWLSGEWGYSDNNRRAKYYQLTRTGRAQLRAQVSSWERYARAVGRAVAAVSPETA